MSDITNIPPPLPIRETHEDNEKERQEKHRKHPQQSSEKAEDYPHNYIPDDDVRISLNAIEEKINQDVKKLLGFYDDIPQDSLNFENTDDIDTPPSTDPAYRQAASTYQKSQQNRYERRPFPFPDGLTLTEDDTEQFEKLKYYWVMLENLRAQHLDDIPHKNGQDVYLSLNSFLKTLF